jgi:hypothetical protein
MKLCVRARFFPILFAAVGCGGSQAPVSPVCTDDFRPGVAVHVKDSLTGAGVASGASLVVREGLFKDSVAFPSSSPDLNDFPLAAAGERAGTYQIAVSKPGYATWSQSNVRVTTNQCHVNTVELTALLQPSA